MSKHYILDALGDTLETDLGVIKIDIVLSDNFIFEVVEAYDLIPLIERYDRKFSIPIYDHDISRAHYLYDLINFYTNNGVEGHEVRYFADTLRVINDWCAKYRRLYMGRYYDAAFSDFMAYCYHMNCLSCIRLPVSELKPMFTYVFCREHFDRHPYLDIPDYYHS